MPLLSLLLSVVRAASVAGVLADDQQISDTQLQAALDGPATMGISAAAPIMHLDDLTGGALQIPRLNKGAFATALEGGAIPSTSASSTPSSSLKLDSLTTSAFSSPGLDALTASSSSSPGLSLPKLDALTASSSSSPGLSLPKLDALTASSSSSPGLSLPKLDALTASASSMLGGGTSGGSVDTSSLAASFSLPKIDLQPLLSVNVPSIKTVDSSAFAASSQLPYLPTLPSVSVPASSFSSVDSAAAFANSLSSSSLSSSSFSFNTPSDSTMPKLDVKPIPTVKKADEFKPNTVASNPSIPYIPITITSSVIGQPCGEFSPCKGDTYCKMGACEALMLAPATNTNFYLPLPSTASTTKDTHAELMATLEQGLNRDLTAGCVTTSNCPLGFFCFNFYCQAATADKLPVGSSLAGAVSLPASGKYCIDHADCPSSFFCSDKKKCESIGDVSRFLQPGIESQYGSAIGSLKAAVGAGGQCLDSTDCPSGQMCFTPSDKVVTKTCMPISGEALGFSGVSKEKSLVLAKMMLSAAKGACTTHDECPQGFFCDKSSCHLMSDPLVVFQSKQ